IRSSSSAICPPSGWWPLSGRPKRRWCTSVRRSISPCWPIPTGRSQPTFPTWPRRSIRPRGGCWCATVSNGAGLLTPEMFASVKILTGEGDNAVAVPRDAIIYEGEAARVWVVRDKDSEKAIELRRIKVGLTNGNMVEVVKGLAPGDRVVTKGSLFIDRVAAGT